MRGYEVQICTHFSHSLGEWWEFNPRVQDVGGIFTPHTTTFAAISEPLGGISGCAFVTFPKYELTQDCAFR